MKNMILSYKDYIKVINEGFESLETFIEELEIIIKQKSVNEEVVIKNSLKISVKDNNTKLFKTKTELLFDEYEILNDDIYIPIENSIRLLEQRYDVELTGDFEIFFKIIDKKNLITENYISFEIA